MANYNHGRFLNRSIEAILTQSSGPDEFIIVDDGSTDDSLRIIESWAQRHPGMKLLRNERNLGFFRSLERLLSQTNAEFVYIAAADDYVFPGFFENAMKMAQRYPRVGVIFGQMITVTESEEYRSTHIASRLPGWTWISPEAFLENYLKAERASYSLSGATIHRREALIEMGGFREELGYWSDTFAIRAIGLKYGAVYLPQICRAKRIVEGSMSGTALDNLDLKLSIATKAAELMRSKQFRDLFPDSYVREWERDIRAEIRTQGSSKRPLWKQILTKVKRVSNRIASGRGVDSQLRKR